MRSNTFFAILSSLALVASACGPAGQSPAPNSGGGGVTVATPNASSNTTPAATTGTPTGAPQPTTAAKPAAQPTTAPAQTSAQPSGPQEITVNALQGEPDNLDPSRSSFATEAAVIRLVFETLLVFDKDLKPGPGAATSFDVSQDGKTYTFHLKPDARWSDGQPVTAKDWVYSFKRILNPDTAAEYATFFSEAGIVGAAEYAAGKGDADEVGIRAKDDNTVEFQLKAPIGYFPNLVALWVVPPLRQDLVTKTGWAQDPSTFIGNGPFKMSEWVHQDHITLVPNPNYSGDKPKLQKITMLMVSSGAADYAAYRNNERDWTLVPDADVNSVRNDPQMSKEAHEYTELTTFWLIMNNGKGPLDNPMFRKAISRAIDRQAMIRDIASGVGKPATSFIPPGMPGYQSDLGQDIDFNAAAAKDLLKQAGYGEGLKPVPPLRFRFATTTANQTRAEFIQAQLKQNLGIDVQLESMEAKAYQAAYKAKDYDLAWGGWGADYPDPQNWMTGLFGCDASNNKYNYCNKQFDEAATRGDTGTDLNQRLQAYAQAQQILANDVPVAPLFFRGRMVLVKPWVQKMVITPKDDYPGWSLLKNVFLTR
ncbi:MAG TPA: peptide ABC transporter substrate-binding protein [Chloroflexota bacterium]